MACRCTAAASQPDVKLRSRSAPTFRKEKLWGRRRSKQRDDNADINADRAMPGLHGGECVQREHSSSTGALSRPLRSSSLGGAVCFASAFGEPRQLREVPLLALCWSIKRLRLGAVESMQSPLQALDDVQPSARAHPEWLRREVSPARGPDNCLATRWRRSTAAAHTDNKRSKIRRPSGEGTRRELQRGTKHAPDGVLQANRCG
ncbi:hypothetical protein P154DRAFT_574087 [Amniculicola lignicola CBS 123094]|uniref:Uncharacterized protein n=1 Tax=Amniculicola lignicola CBS 123094 TaxID=1392246 RepID=A0A6A5WKX0_9PLEO|nr:hypothetical protein P154DRAFT_574087 [Amniculicola lignicola CBS 123094]